MKKGRSDEVHPFVGALGAEDDRYQQFERVAIVQFRFGYGHGFFKIGNDFVV